MTLRLFPWLLRVMPQWTRGFRYLFKTVILFLLGTSPEARALDHIGVLFLNFWGTAIAFSIVGVPVYIPTHRVEQFPCQQSLSLAFLIVAILTGGRGHLIVVLICLSLKISDDEPFFICLLAITVSSSEKYLFRYFAYFSIVLCVSLLLNCRSFLYILHINPLSDNMVCNCFLPSHRLPFRFIDCFLCCAEALFFLF